MRVFLIRRVLAVIPVMMVVATVAFVLIHLAPGDPASVIAGPDASQSEVAKIRHQLGLDESLAVQLYRWYGKLLRGDLGDSIFLRRPVLQAIAERVEPTLLLTLWGTVVAVLIGVPAGVVSARHHNSAVDQSFMAMALLGLSIPNFLLGLLMILVFGVWLGWLPVAGYVPLEDGVMANVRSLVMPALALGLVQSALIARIARACMVEVLAQDYIRTARAKGLSQGAVVAVHAFRNALVPVVTVVGITMAILIGGAVVTEIVFNIPGLGRLVVSAILRRDYPVVQGVVLVTAAAYVLINLGVDMVYAFIDPRIRY